MYKVKYNKEHYKAFKVDLKIEELEELEKMLKDDNVSKAQFLREAILNYGINKSIREYAKRYGESIKK